MGIDFFHSKKFSFIFRGTEACELSKKKKRRKTLLTSLLVTRRIGMAANKASLALWGFMGIFCAAVMCP